MVVAVLAHLEHPGGGVGGLVAAFSLCAALYAGYTEVCRIGRREAQIITLQEKVRELMQSRRAAGLLRLEADVRRRRQDFPQPPFSGATAALARRHLRAIGSDNGFQFRSHLHEPAVEGPFDLVISK